MTTTATGLDSPAQGPAFRRVGASRKLKDGVARVAVWACFLLAAAPLIWVLYTVVANGLPAVLRPMWWSHSLNGVLPNEFLGGAYHAIIGTMYQGLITAVISVPIGILVAVYLVEYGAGSKLAKATTFMVDILTGIPSIVAGLFIYAVWITTAGLQRNTFAMCLALVLLAVPVVVRTTEEMLRIVPNELREASYALGVPKWKTIVRVVLPTALSGIVTGVMLAVARVMGETAPALILLSYADWINFDPFNGAMANLPLMINSEFLNPTDAGYQRTWGAALTLVLIIMLFNLAATIVSRLSAIKKK
jgi:phosphate transport system permease protein